MENKTLTEAYLPLTVLPPPQFETERMILRASTPDDARLIFDLYAKDPVATKYMSFKCTGNIEDTRAFLVGCSNYLAMQPAPIRQFQWVMIEKSSRQPIGGTGFGPKNPSTLSGGYILNQSWWGKGFATEAFKCLVNWAKDQPGVKRFEATHHPENVASGKVLAKCGLRFEGIVANAFTYPNVSDVPQDSAMYAWTRP